MSIFRKRANSAHLSAQRIHNLLSNCKWTAGGQLRVLCTIHTAPLLKRAGIPFPKPVTVYLIDAHWGEDCRLALGKSPAPPLPLPLP